MPQGSPELSHTLPCKPDFDAARRFDAQAEAEAPVEWFASNT
jgi:hypothetical protein